MWKDFFYYSKSERRAIYVLVVLIALLLVVIIKLPDRRVVSYPDSSVNDSTELANFLAEVRTRKTNIPKHVHKTPKEVPHLTVFNPNTADSIELSALGLSPFVVRNVLKYREKGGKFATVESFSRIYGLEKEQFETLNPYIHIPKEQVLERPDTVKIIRPWKYPEGTLVDVNLADTSELKKIPGIGTVIAKRIVGYRNRLGGFYHVSQLKELDCITPELMKWFKVEGGEIKKLKANQASLDELRSHPYLNFYQAKVIVEHRKKKGQIKSLSQLSLYEEFTEKDLKHLSHYLTFD